MILAKRLDDAIFILQRLLIRESWCGPLYLVLFSAARREDLERHPLLQPLLAEGTAISSSSRNRIIGHRRWGAELPAQHHHLLGGGPGLE